MLTCGYASDKGLQRERNEDSGLCRKDLGLFVLADGMGGHNAGNVASRLAVDTVESAFLGSQSGSTFDITDAIQRANSAVYSAGPNMGSTLEVLWISQERAIIGHVGDSRVYLIRDGGIKQITADHSRVAELVAAGTLSPEDAREYPFQHVITRAVGIEDAVSPDIVGIDLLDGDVLVLCSDGLTGDLANAVVTDEEMVGVIAIADDLDIACTNLVDLANERGGLDNITVILVGFHSGADTEAADDSDPAQDMKRTSTESQPHSMKRVFSGTRGEKCAALTAAFLRGSISSLLKRKHKDGRNTGDDIGK